MSKRFHGELRTDDAQTEQPLTLFLEGESTLMTVREGERLVVTDVEIVTASALEVDLRFTPSSGGDFIAGGPFAASGGRSGPLATARVGLAGQGISVQASGAGTIRCTVIGTVEEV